MKKMKNWVISISLVSVFAMFYSCSSDDSFIDELETFERGNGSRSVKSGYDEILNSTEFRHLMKSYSELISLVRTSLDDMTNEEKEEMLDLHILYKGDSLKYASIYRCFTDEKFYKNNLTNSIKTYQTFLKAKNKILANEKYKKYIENNENFISYLLMQNAGQVPSLSIRTTKSRSEEEVQACLNECKSIYDQEMLKAEVLLGCKSAINIISCLLSHGATLIDDLKDELLAIACYEYEKQRATEKYENCKKECEK